jgi:hypothetical protein
MHKQSCHTNNTFPYWVHCDCWNRLMCASNLLPVLEIESVSIFISRQNSTTCTVYTERFRWLSSGLSRRVFQEESIITWWRRQQTPLKRRWTSNRLRVGKSEKTHLYTFREKLISKWQLYFRNIMVKNVGKYPSVMLIDIVLRLIHAYKQRN